MRNIDVLFLVEHIDRELDAVTCVMQKLQSQFGIMADARNFYLDMAYTLNRYNPKIVVFPFFYGADHLQPIAYLSQWPRACFVNMAWEQILAKLDLRMKVPRDDVAKKKVHHLCWSNGHKNFLAHHGVIPANLELVGNPALKFYDLPYRSYFNSRDQLAKAHRLDPARKWILFPENYLFAFLSDQNLKELAEQQNADPDFLEHARSYCDRSLKKLFAWANELDGSQDPLLIVRPRPATTRDQMVSFMLRTIGSSNENLKIIKAQTAREWILAADHVISSHSTTLIEAALAGKPIHRFSPEPFPAALEAEWHSLVPELNDREAFLGAMWQTPIKPTGEPLADWARTRFFPVGDPFNAITEAIARFHAAAAPHTRPSVPDHKCLWWGRIAIEYMRKRIQRLPVLVRHNKGYNFAIPRRAADIFGADDVAKRFSRWHQVLNASTCAKSTEQNRAPICTG